MVEIDDKIFEEIIINLDTYLYDDCLIECVESAIAKLNKYRNFEKIPILKNCEVWNEESNMLELHPQLDINKVKAKLTKLGCNLNNG